MHLLILFLEILCLLPMISDDKVHIFDENEIEVNKTSNEKFKYGQNISFKCEKGYKLKESENATCNKSSQFEFNKENQPECESLFLFLNLQNFRYLICS